MASEPAPNKPGTNTNERAIALVFAGILAGVVIMAFALAFLLDSLSWDWKVLTGSEKPNLIEAWRNLGLIALGVVGVGLATWRSILAHQQNKNAIAQRLISERGMNVDRYQKGAQMLESEELSVRIAGIYGLRELAISDPKESYIIVQSLLFAFIREKSKARAPRPASSDDEAEAEAGTRTAHEDLGPDVSEALDATTALRKAIPDAHHLEKEAQWCPNLAAANLSGANLDKASLSNANLDDGNLSRASLFRANLAGANLIAANMSHARLLGAELPGTVLFLANLSGTEFVRANLSGTDLLHANLSGAVLFRANLSGAMLEGADLSDANLDKANLSGADLGSANLSGANFSGSVLDEHTNLTGIWAWADRPPKNQPPEIEAAITYRDPAKRKEDN